jgi:hypothetical protein
MGVALIAHAGREANEIMTANQKLPFSWEIKVYYLITDNLVCVVLIVMRCP